MKNLMDNTVSLIIYGVQTFQEIKKKKLHGFPFYVLVERDYSNLAHY